MEIGEWGIYGWDIYDLVGWGSYGKGLLVGATTGFGIGETMLLLL